MTRGATADKGKQDDGLAYRDSVLRHDPEWRDGDVFDFLGIGDGIALAAAQRQGEVTSMAIPTSGSGDEVTLIREYRNGREQQVETRALARLGFTPVAVGNVSPQVGIARIALLGIFAAVFRPHARVTVTYHGHGPLPTRDQINYAKAAASMQDARASLASVKRVWVAGEYLMSRVGAWLAGSGKDSDK